ncbi:YrdB family protein [Fodinicola acaciae]|uniref:YrdB family protein n=1 Tax=Fodinicola acaciae TaxID=2681555 RepID=UPI0013D44C81|nr:YrdB family protein [Fodinicola acaciae]
MEAFVAKVNPGVRAVLEICAFVSLGLAGFALIQGVLGWLLAAVLPLAAIVAWAMFCSPKATMPLSLPGRIVVEAVIFGCAVAALAFIGQGWLALLFGVVALASGAYKHYTDR